MQITFDFDNLTRIVFGSGKLEMLGTLPMPGKKALVLISNGPNKKIIRRKNI